MRIVMAAVLGVLALGRAPGVAVLQSVASHPAASQSAVPHPATSRPAATTVESLLQEGRAAREAGDMDRALALYAEAARREPGNRLAAYNAGILLENDGRPGEAAGVWTSSLGEDPGDLFAWEHLVRCLAATGALDQAIEAATRALAAHPEAEMPRLRLALALQAARRGADAVPPLESLLVAKPSSNIAYAFLKDAFPSRAEFLDYVQDVARRAAAPGAPEGLRLLRIRLLLERGRVDEARGIAAGGDWAQPDSLLLLRRAGVLSAAGPQEIPSPAPVTEAGSGARPSSAPAPPAQPSPAPLPSPSMAPASEMPGFDPGDPRSAARLVRSAEEAQHAGDLDTAAARIRRALDASPLSLEPRMQLAQILSQAGQGEEARQALRGPLAASPWDLYMQAWRAVRDDFVDPDHGGADIFRMREQARDRVRSIPEAQREIAALLAALHDPWARVFSPPAFADFLLAPAAARLKRTDSALRGAFLEPQAPVPRVAVDGVDAASPAPLVDPPPVAGFIPAPPDGAAPRLAHVRIPSLAGLDVPERVERLLAGTRGAAGVVIDLRGNRGGEGAVAVRVASLFLPRGAEVCTFVTRRAPTRETVEAESRFRPSGPLAVLVDGATASAAELLAETLRRSAGALLVGGRTAGKGVGQRVVLLPDGSGLSLTRFRIVPPGGASWDGGGLRPDIEVEDGSEASGGSGDAALEAARSALLARLAG